MLQVRISVVFANYFIFRRAVLTLFAFGIIVLPSIAYNQTPQTEVPISTIIQGYYNNEYQKIDVRFSNVIAYKQNGEKVIAMKDRETIADFGFNDPNNPTVVTIEKIEVGLATKILPDIIFFVVFVLGFFFILRAAVKSGVKAGMKTK